MNFRYKGARFTQKKNFSCQNLMAKSQNGKSFFMIQPKGFQIERHEEKVYRLRKSLYGLN